MRQTDPRLLHDRATTLQNSVRDLLRRRTPLTRANVVRVADGVDLLFRDCVNGIERTGAGATLHETTQEITKTLTSITTNLANDALIPAIAALRRTMHQVCDIAAFLKIEEQMSHLSSNKPKFMIGSNITPTAGSYRTPMMELIQAAASKRGEPVSDWIFEACLERLRVEGGAKPL